MSDRSQGGRNPAADASPRRGAIAAAGFAMQLAFGSVYGWSVFLNPLRDLYGASRAEVGFTFTLTLVTLGLTAALGGALQARLGPRRAATLAGLLYGAGVALSGFTPSLPALYLTYGVLGGVGLGLGYIVPLAVLIPWFPDRRGFITGLAVAGFGSGALVSSPLAAALIATAGVRPTFVALGVAYLIVVVVAAQVLRTAPAGYAPPGWAPLHEAAEPARGTALGEALRRPLWFLLWLVLALNVSAGAALLSVAAPLTQELSGVSAAAAAGLVGLLSVANGVGRLAWGSLSDRIGRAPAFLGLLALQLPAFAAVALGEGFPVLAAGAAVIALCYGGGFGVMPAWVADAFGARSAGPIYGAMLTAWSAGAILGPVLITALPYRTALLVLLALLALLAAALPLPLMAAAQARRADGR